MYSVAYKVPGIYQTSADASQKIRVIVRQDPVTGEIKIEAVPNANTPGGCDAATALMAERAKLSGSEKSVVDRHPIEEKITTPSEEQVEEIRQTQSKPGF